MLAEDDPRGRPTLPPREPRPRLGRADGEVGVDPGVMEAAEEATAAAAVLCIKASDNILAYCDCGLPEAAAKACK